MSIVCSDEIYEKLLYTDEPFRSFATLLGGIADRTIIISGVSKAYAMTGWRIGWTLAPKELTAAMDNLQSQETSNPCSVSQYAAVAALNGPQDCVETMRQEFARRRTYTLGRIRALPGINLPDPGGAFYAFFNVSPYFGKPLGKGTVVNNSTDFCTALLEEAHVALVTRRRFRSPRLRAAVVRDGNGRPRSRLRPPGGVPARKVAISKVSSRSVETRSVRPSAPHSRVTPDAAAPRSPREKNPLASRDIQRKLFCPLYPQGGRVTEATPPP